MASAINRISREETDESQLRGGLSAGPMESELGFHLRRAQVASFRNFAQTVTAAEGLTPGLYGMLQVIANNPGLAQSRLAEAMEVDRSSIVKVVNQLEERGLILRLPSPTDRRSHSLTMTPEGRLALRRIEAAVARQDRDFAAGLSEPDREALIGLLKRLYGQTGGKP